MPPRLLAQVDLERIAVRLRKEHDEGLIPLFVIGAGLSNSNRVPHVPTFEQMLDRLRLLVEDEAPNASTSDRSFHELHRLFQDHASTAWDDSVVVTRILMEAQQSRSESVQACWDAFSNWLLWDCLVAPRDTMSPKNGIVHAEPTPAHLALASLFKTLGALCISLNFDGLTRKALRSSGFQRALILDDPKAVEDFFCRPAGESSEPHEEMVAVVKLRGDAFMAACQRDGCPLHDKPIPLWNLSDVPLLQPAQHLQCPACRHPRKIGISFPGVPEKEVAAQHMLTAFWKYCAARTGSIFVIGLSGRWDRTVSSFVTRLARVRHIPVCVVRRSPNNDYVFRGTVASSAREGQQDSGYFAATSDDFAESLASLVMSTSKPSFTPISMAPRAQRAAGDDRFWDKHFATNELRATDTSLSELEKHIISHPQFERLANIAQLGLKNYWLGIDAADTTSVHNRKVHSLGAMRLVSAVYLSLRDHRSGVSNSDRLHTRRPLREHYFLRLSALLHDIGHMPFSHMLEEVFEELSWVLQADTRVFRHTDYSSQIVRSICSDPAVAALLAQQYGYSADQLIALINGATGVHYLDALIDSPVDVDKIDYVFRDSDVCKRRTTLPLAGEWLSRLIRSDDLSVSPEGYLKLGGEAASLYLHLLEARHQLYETFYLSPHIRFPEALTRFVLVLCLITKIVPGRLKFTSVGSTGLGRDLGHAKILEAQRYLFELAESVRADASQYELTIANQIIAELRRSSLHPNILESLDIIAQVIAAHGDDDLKRLYAEYILGEPLLLSSSVSLEPIRKLARDVVLRKPGAIVVDVARPTAFLSSSRRRRVTVAPRLIIDQDCALAPEQNPRYWKAGDPAVKPLSAALNSFPLGVGHTTRISIFRISPNENYARQARDLFLTNLRAEGVI